jgi:DNA-directed RNA polymerase subunit RPC12/RpoP
MASKKKTFTYFCEDCGHSFTHAVASGENPDLVRCEKCNSEFVNHEFDRSIFVNLGMTEHERCPAEGCSTCNMGEFCSPKQSDEEEFV